MIREIRENCKNGYISHDSVSDGPRNPLGAPWAPPNPGVGTPLYYYFLKIGARIQNYA